MENTRRRNEVVDKQVTAEQAKEAIRTIRNFCRSVSDKNCRNEKCPLKEWCRLKEPTPENWKIEYGGVYAPSQRRPQL